ncbi:hypothetical protein [Bacillus sp. FJAT-27264]|uniref:hypothetical protein n=1 Tax=Paenibacillus sp. (strain DSM 101736 / FJAT-27264) TaxID=1850362 RepID=UPI001111F3A7|nr:hypothetical protein [Bacillus sp. FJAT-27264]
MKRLIGTLFALLLISGCAHPSLAQVDKTNEPEVVQVSSQSWSFDKIIIFNKTIYLGTEIKVASTDIKESIGEIKAYSDKESETSKDDFSNHYPVGTKIFKIKDQSIQTAIAVEINKDNFILAQIEKE